VYSIVVHNLISQTSFIIGVYRGISIGIGSAWLGGELRLIGFRCTP